MCLVDLDTKQLTLFQLEMQADIPNQLQYASLVQSSNNDDLRLKLHSLSHWIY